jgi:hypothetical protein
LKERNWKERTKHAYIRTNGFFLSKQILKERQTNFERTLFDQTTYPDFNEKLEPTFLQKNLSKLEKQNLNVMF